MKSPDALIAVSLTMALLILLSMLAACEQESAVAVDQSPGAPAPSQPLPPPAAQTAVVRGEVFSFDAGAIEGADIYLWVHSDLWGTSLYSYDLDGFDLPKSDGLGQFGVSLPVGSRFTLLARRQGLVQPCGVASVATADLTLRVEMVPEAALDVASAPRPQLSTEPSVSGVVYESSVDGRHPIADADVWARRPDGFLHIDLATTKSDRSGGFFLCGVLGPVEVHVAHPGHAPVKIGPIDVGESQHLDIELKRL